MFRNARMHYLRFEVLLVPVLEMSFKTRWSLVEYPSFSIPLQDSYAISIDEIYRGTIINLIHEDAVTSLWLELINVKTERVRLKNGFKTNVLTLSYHLKDQRKID